MLFRLIKRRRAIKRFVRQLPLDLQRRFGEKQHYSLEEIDRGTASEDYDRRFVAFAHALFCSRQDFDLYYGPLKVNCTYDGLRAFVAQRYFRGVTDFDACSIFRFAGQTTNKDSVHENGLSYWSGSGE